MDLGGPADYFVPGSLISCTTCSDVTVKGEVLAFDPKTKILILKLPSTSGRGNFNDAHMVNLNMVSDVKVLSEGTAPPKPGPLPDLNIQKLNNRLRDQTMRKKRLIMAYKAGIAPEGQKLFKAISKTLDDVDWSGDKIIVMDKITIAPPYKPENVKGVKDSKAYIHVKNIVEKHCNDELGGGERDGSIPILKSNSSSSVSSVNNENSNSSVSSASSSRGPGGGGGPPSSSSNSRSTNRHKPIFPWARNQQQII